MALRFLFDTDHLTLFEHKHPLLLQRYTALQKDEVGVAAVTVEESLRGRLAPLARARTPIERIDGYARFVKTFLLISQLPIIAFDQAAEDQFQALLALKLRIGTPDLKIAAVALANSVTLLTRNRHDFGRISNLPLDDWSV